MSPRALLLSASLPRVLLEGSILTVVLLAVLTALAGSQQNSDIELYLLGLRALTIGLIVAPVMAVRLRLQRGPVAQRFKDEALCGIVLLASVLLLSWISLSAVTTISTGSRVFAGIDPVSLVFSYALWRGVLCLWPSWDRRRRSRIVWALSHAQLVVSLILAFFLSIVLTVVAARSIDARLPGSGELDGAAATLAWASMQLIIVTNMFVFSMVVIGLVLIPSASMISLYVLRGTTRRLEDLNRATALIRNGELSTRVDVEGEDEVAALQSDFNAMAADLERLVQELASERDTTQQLLNARRQLIASVSHELRTPVASMRGYLESAQRQWGHDIPETLRTDLSVMSREAERLQRLIEDLFALSRLEADGVQISREPVDVGALLQQLVESSAPLAWESGRVRVMFSSSDDLPPVLADSGRLEQVVRNLLSNAVRHTWAGGMVMVDARPDQAAIAIKVSDTGGGIPPDELPAIWDRFHRGDDARESDPAGAGLGLALVAELVKAMDGSVDVESKIDQGSTFTVRLPIADPVPSKSPVTSDSSPAR